MGLSQNCGYFKYDANSKKKLIFDGFDFRVGFGSELHSMAKQSNLSLLEP